MNGMRLGVAALAIAVANAAAAQHPSRQVRVAQGYGLTLATAAQAMHYAGDVSFDGGRIQARAGIAVLADGGEPPRRTSAVDAALRAGAWFAVNDRRGRTYLLHVLAAEGARATVEVSPAKSQMQLVSGAGAQRGVAMPSYHGVPMPTYRGVPMRTAGGDSVTATGNAKPKAEKGPVQPPAPRDTARALPPLRGETVDLSVYHMEGGNQLTKYYFRKDGTFRREYVGRASLSSVSHEERGEYAIQGGVLTLRLRRQYTAATGGIPNNQYMTGGQSQAATIETHRIRIQGTSAVIDGVAYQHLTW
jgi:hypothetical protein